MALGTRRERQERGPAGRARRPCSGRCATDAGAEGARGGRRLPLLWRAQEMLLHDRRPTRAMSQRARPYLPHERGGGSSESPGLGQVGAALACGGHWRRRRRGGGGAEQPSLQPPPETKTPPPLSQVVAAAAFSVSLHTLPPGRQPFPTLFDMILFPICTHNYLTPNGFLRPSQKRTNSLRWP